MRTLLAAALLIAATVAIAEDAPKPLAITVEPLGDRDDGVVTKVSFRFANPRAITRAGLFLEGSLAQEGEVPRNFRFAVPRKDDKGQWTDTIARNDRFFREWRWTMMPDQRNEMSAIHLFLEGPAQIEARLILNMDYGGAPRVIAQAAETFTIAKTNRAYVVEEDDPPEADEDKVVGAVRLRTSTRGDAQHLVLARVDVLPPVKRVEFWIGEKKIVARNAAPYNADLDVGESEAGVTVRAIGFDATGKYVDADAVVIGEDVPVKITRVATSDGVTHFKVSVRNARVKSVALFADDTKLHAWSEPPYALSVPTESLHGVKLVRAMVIDDAGSETTDVLELR